MGGKKQLIEKQPRDFVEMIKKRMPTVALITQVRLPSLFLVVWHIVIKNIKKSVHHSPIAYQVQLQEAILNNSSDWVATFIHSDGIAAVSQVLYTLGKR